MAGNGTLRALPLQVYGDRGDRTVAWRQAAAPSARRAPLPCGSFDGAHRPATMHGMRSQHLGTWDEML
eukprot:4235012-Prorocentrum_lima.AAC.1